MDDVLERTTGRQQPAGAMVDLSTPVPALDELQLIADGVRGVAGFGVAAIRILRGDELEMVAATDHEGIGTRIPLQMMLGELAGAEHWGSLLFVAHDSVPAADHDAAWVVPDLEVPDYPDAWHPLDMLVAPLYDDHGRLLGTLAIDEPGDGRLPGPDRRRELEKYASLTCRAVVATLEREELARQVEMAERVKKIVRTTSAMLSPADLMRESERALMESFDVPGMWIQTFGSDGQARVASPEGVQVDLPADLVAVAEAAADHCWRHQQVMVLGHAHPMPRHLDAATHARILDFLAGLEVDTLLLVPLGAGLECLGTLALTRSGAHRAWSEIECDALLDVGQDLGRALSTAQTFERARGLVAELQALDIYKSQVIATISHELKNPLAAIAGYLEMLQEPAGVPAPVQKSLTAMGRSTERMARLVQNLLLLSKVGNPENRLIAVPIDLDALVADVLQVFELPARERGVRLEVDRASEPVVALGDADELDKVVLNLLSNAIKFAGEGGVVRVRTARTADGVELVVADEGIGISTEDQARLFEEFFRSNDPAAHLQPGTGLGLTIVGRIVARHDGRIVVTSAPGSGSAFTVTLPAAAL